MFSCVSAEFSFGGMSSVLSGLPPITLISPELSQICACSFQKCNVPKCHFFTSSVLLFGLCIPVQCFLFSFWIGIILFLPFVIKNAAIFSDYCCIMLGKCSWFYSPRFIIKMKGFCTWDLQDPTSGLAPVKTSINILDNMVERIDY